MEVIKGHDSTRVSREAAGNEGNQKLYAELDSNRDASLDLARQAAGKGKQPESGSLPGFLPPYIVEEMASRGDRSVLNGNMKAPPAEKNGAETKLADEKPHGEREVYDAHFGYANPGNKARFEGEAPVGISDVDNVYNYTGMVRDFYKNVFGRDSIDGQGMKVVSTVNYGENFQNAMWDQGQMYYGHPVDKSIFKSFILLDVTGHELTHGVTENETHLWHWDQAGALHEHFSDVFGEMAEQYALHQTADQADWLHAEGVFKPDVHARGIRDLLNPGTAFDDPRIGKDPQPAHMKDYVKGNKDNGYVHVNSGIPNRAFALFAKSVGGYSWEDPGHIWYDARKAAGNNPTFASFAYQTIEQAKALNHPGVVEKLEKAWDAVGVVPSLQAIDAKEQAVVKKAN